MTENDREQRRRAIEDAGHSFVVEASAGTGKTSTLINRIIHLVIEKGPSGPPIKLSQICAITFTEKAAGEMKVRLRQHFENIIADQSASIVERAQVALHDLESASISTFHSFAVSLLKERPIDAGLDPHFTALDEIRSELFFREVWDEWISRALVERNPVLEKALRNGITLQNLKDLAGTLRTNSHAVNMLHPDTPLEDSEIRDRIRDLLQEAERHAKKIFKHEDKLAEYLDKAIAWLKNPGPDCDRPSKPGRAGVAANWNGGKAALQIVQEYIRTVVDFCVSCENLPKQRLLHKIIGLLLLEFIPEWKNRKRAGGLLDFDDQLWFARELLREKQSVRQEFQSRFATLLVDEFQDTDSIQWDIVRLLSSSDTEECDLVKLRPGPGRLFIVGDPKQSIYRFRNADIETYLEIVDEEQRRSLGLERLQLTTNFRSVPSILRFVDAAFNDVMKAPDDGSYQPDYLSFGEEGGRSLELSSPSVHLLGDKNIISSMTVREFLELEASRIAGLISSIRGSESWKIQDQSNAWRTPRYGDIAILLPVLSRADVLEDALRDREIPYVLEGGKFYYARSEVSSAITVLRALVNPNDKVALYGTLRSIFFGFSDEDLLRAHIQGQPLDYREEVSENSPFHFPFTILRDLHRQRHVRRASETFELLLQMTGVREVLAARGFQSLANLNKLSRTLRSLQGDTAFSHVVNLLNTMDDEGLAESESRLMEERSDAVRIMSIHKSKGLDFPIVIAAGLGQKKRPRSGNLLADFHRKKIFGVSIGPMYSGLQTPGWRELVDEERKRENAELVRLLYVALTRARDHMIISTHTQNWKHPEEGKPSVPETEGTRLQPLVLFLEKSISGNSDLVHWIDDKDLGGSIRPRQAALLPMVADWPEIIERQYSDLHELLEKTPASRNLAAAGQRGEGEEQLREVAVSRAVRLGVAFHEAMERVDLLQSAYSPGLVKELIERHNLDRESARALEEMVERCLSSDLLGRVRTAAGLGGRILREMPFVRPLAGGGIEEGKIDLLFQEEGGWVLVDYKTDWVSKDADESDQFFRERYAGQVYEYKEAMRGLSVEIASAYLLLARNGRSVKIC
jgi:ATP-dependent helicase/nuclease subunit A